MTKSRSRSSARVLRISRLAVLIALFTSPALAQTSPGIPGVLALGVLPELVQGGFTALEGPVGAADGTVYFSDRMPDRTYHLGLDGKITVYQENTGAANGLAFTRDGDMVRAEGGAKRIGKVTRDGKVSMLTDSYNGKPLVSPNDLIVDAKGGIYFTDPGPRPIMPGRPTNVYYLPAGAKEPILIDDQNPRPNGLTLSTVVRFSSTTRLDQWCLRSTCKATGRSKTGDRSSSSRTFLRARRAAPTAWRSTAKAASM
jgi:gluconolactonase